jgi:hypothetical protein
MQAGKEEPTMKIFVVGLMALLAAVTSGCGAAREAQQAAANAPTANVAGTWTGNAGTGGISAPITLTLTQNGTNLSGNINVGGRMDLSGPVKGTIQGEIVKLSLTTVTLGQMIAKDGTMTGEVSGGLPTTLRKVQ